MAVTFLRADILAKLCRCFYIQFQIGISHLKHPNCNAVNNKLKVQDNDEITCHGGDWSFIPAGLDHSMIPSAPGKELYYVWFEQYTRKESPIQFIEPTEDELNDY